MIGMMKKERETIIRCEITTNSTMKRAGDQPVDLKQSTLREENSHAKVSTPNS